MLRLASRCASSMGMAAGTASASVAVLRCGTDVDARSAPGFDERSMMVISSRTGEGVSKSSRSITVGCR